MTWNLLRLYRRWRTYRQTNNWERKSCPSGW
jgi:hypothetical protein